MVKRKGKGKEKKIHNVVKYKQREHYKQTNKQIKRTGRRRRKKKRKKETSNHFIAFP